MIYYAFLAIIDIGWYLWENKINLTFTLVASGIGVIIGKRLGTRIAINYIMRSFGLHKKPIIEQQVEWLMEQERKRGNQWSANTSKPYRLGINRLLLKRSIWSRMVRSIAQFTKLHMRWRKKNMSRKLVMMIFGTIVMTLSQFGITLDPETIIGMCTLLISAIVGQSAVDTNGVGQYAPLKEKFKSVKLWTALGGSVLLVISDYYGLNISETVIYLFSGLGATFILGRSAVSVVQASKNGGNVNDQLNIPIEPPL